MIVSILKNRLQNIPPLPMGPLITGWTDKNNETVTLDQSSVAKYVLDSRPPSALELIEEARHDMGHLVNIYSSSQRKRLAAEKEANELRVSLDALRMAHQEVQAVNKGLAGENATLSTQVQETTELRHQLQKAQREAAALRQKVKNKSSHQRQKIRKGRARHRAGYANDSLLHHPYHSYLTY
jgi:chromosome segregation ATPase